jgi:hypothetical protein
VEDVLDALARTPAREQGADMTSDGSRTMDQAELLGLEEQFWKGDAEFYQRHLTADAIMAFPDPVGRMGKDATVASIAHAPRWSSVDMSEVATLELGPGAVLLLYRARARREGDSSDYRADVSSIYVDRGAGWQLVFHQQAPI